MGMGATQFVGAGHISTRVSNRAYLEFRVVTELATHVSKYTL